MKNRIAGYLGNGNKNVISDLPETGKDPAETAPKPGDLCGFCGRNIEKAPFCARTYSGHSHPTAICMSCIDNYGRQAQFAKNFPIWYEAKPNYSALAARVRRRIAGEGGSNALKYTLVDVAIRLLKRQSALLADVVDATCPKTGVALTGTPRIAIIGEDSQYCATLLPVIFKELGIIYRSAEREELANGEAFKQMTALDANGETSWSKYGVLYCLGYVAPKTNSIVIYAGRYSDEFPADVEKVYIKES